MAVSPRLALRLAGLQVYSRLLARSPGKALCAAPGVHQRPNWIRFRGGASSLSRLLSQQPLQPRLTPVFDPFAKHKQA